MEMAEIWYPGTFLADIWTYKISALYLLYFQSYQTFIDVLKVISTKSFIALKVQEIES